MNRSQLKIKARGSLYGKYGEIIKMFLIVVLVSCLVGFVAGCLDYLCGTSYIYEDVDFFGIPIKNEFHLFTGLSEIILSSILSFGFFSYFLKISRDQEVTYKEVFSRSNLALFFIGLTFAISVFVSLWSLLLIIPGIIASIAYRMAYFIKLDNPDIGVLDAIIKSKELMRGHKWDFFVLQLSFLGWVILGALTLGILYFWLIPYMAVTEANFYNDLLA